MFVDHLALGIVFDFAFLVAVGEAGDCLRAAAFGHFFAGEIKFFAADPINGPRGFQRFGRATPRHARRRSRFWSQGDSALMASATLQSFFSDGVEVLNDDVIVILRLLEACLDVDVVRRAIEQLGSRAPARRVGRARSDTRSW